LPFQDATFDAITTFSSFHWWYRIPGVLTEMHRVLRPGGCFLVINKHDTGPFRKEARGIIAQFSPHEITDARKEYDPEGVLTADGRWAVSTQELLYEEQFTLPELLAQIRSISAWNAVPGARRDEALEALESHFASQLVDGLYHRPLQMKIVVARRTDATASGDRAG